MTKQFPLFTKKDAQDVISVMKKALTLEPVTEDVPTLIKTIERVARICDGVWIPPEAL